MPSARATPNSRRRSKVARSIAFATPKAAIPKMNAATTQFIESA